MTEAAVSKSKWRWLRILGSMIACTGILGGAAAAIYYINTTEPVATQVKSVRKSAALVETTTAERGDYSPQIEVLGTVQAASEVLLSPRVSGQVSSLSQKFVPGGTVNAGDVLVQIDPTDFKNTLSIRKSELEQVEASLQIEEGRQLLAQQELELLQDTIKDLNRSLVLREPQIASIRAEVNAAKAEVQRAQIDLERTEVKAPFDAQILNRSVNVGSQVSPGDELARLVGLDEYWVMASVPLRSLRWVEFPEIDGQGSEVILRDSDTWLPGTERTAVVSRLIGTLDDQTRLARVLITVADPLGRESDVPPLVLDTLIETQIVGRPLEDVVRIEREYVRDKDTVWVMKDSKLEIRSVEIVFRDAQYAYISSGLENDDEVVTTNLATVASGIPLRKIESEPETADSSASSTEEETP
ncbi:MAG: efflux RND transporter periplasmic adaptor subunit [Planctomyces sp.]|uniref:Efflux transporter, RND family, MFP subunit n=1 Tax=Rubinisphaera brasiliensis (strain ATCC 49424 / DSM 5305 / JCM 21570 / IAM 15109 / NBRC 103401 / IFAM 1448) TaxID=756272 RepID=F0SI01_RUBBR|nr:efflux RND transporter periplasmic adaptor subunit [Rubinisphaera brasiliensis]ADY60684.1 efflux transporter, RND family, MFP subunit [Rubinisphaera brasiliensis DSM 5305]MBB01093.1 efflux RND transporter periplasmic adaptor subunit [Planctomyces sp.]